MDFKMLGARIRAYRKALNMTQEELAEKAEISLSFLGHLERGARQPSLETLVTLANALGASTDSLLQDSLGDQSLQRSKTEGNRQQILNELNRILQQGADYWIEE